MAKLIRVSSTKAFRIEAVQVGDVQGINIRQMYATKNDTTLKPGYQGIFLPMDADIAERVLRAAGKMAVSKNTEFTVVEPAPKEKRARK